MIHMILIQLNLPIFTRNVPQAIPTLADVSRSGFRSHGWRIVKAQLPDRESVNRAYHMAKHYILFAGFDKRDSCFF
jgi:hypothetical protein